MALEGVMVRTWFALLSNWFTKLSTWELPGQLNADKPCEATETGV